MKSNNLADLVDEKQPLLPRELDRPKQEDQGKKTSNSIAVATLHENVKFYRFI